MPLEGRMLTGDADVPTEPGDDVVPGPPGDPPSVEPSGGEASCRVELFGLARSIVGQRALDIVLPRESTVADALARLAAAPPALVGQVIRADGKGLTEGHLLNLNGKSFVEDVETAVEPGDTLLILSNTAGG